MSLETRYSQFDALAFLYSGLESSKVCMMVLEKFILQHLPNESHILDLCCGRGELVQLLRIKGYRATGLDGSEVMLHDARENVPDAEFILDDARFFKLPPIFHAVVSTENSFSYVTSLEELISVFHNVHAALQSNGWFAFDLNQEERYPIDEEISSSSFTDDYATIECSSYDPEEKISKSNLVLFRLINGEWQRSNVTVLQKAYSTAEVQSALKKVGFTEISIYDAGRNLGIPKMDGRMVYICRKLIDS
ncbi:MAG: class I SAM-dependent methyltransferase [Rhizonema sp. PD38]|nr:class I SAM-dependent methyltransferase [Rhizonema sp. PD38]